MRSLLVVWLLLVYENVWCQGLIFTSGANEGSDPTSLKPVRKTTNRPSTSLEKIENTEQQIPLIDQDKCPGNQLFYPGNPWYCDCGPTFIFYPPKNECYRAYMRGPCEEGQHLVVKNRTVLCVRNPCQENYVRYRGTCYELEKSEGPCGEIDGTIAFLKVNFSTLAVECTKSSAEALHLLKFSARCFPGSKYEENVCQNNWNV